jgi:heme/copper-type cytochrome/quinol oxidase subunit 2
MVPHAVPEDWSPHVAARADLPPLAMVVGAVAVVYDTEQGYLREDRNSPRHLRWLSLYLVLLVVLVVVVVVVVVVGWW